MANQGLTGRRLRVVVLPFRASGSFTSDGLRVSLAHEVAAALARFRWFDVITPFPLDGLSGPCASDRAIWEAGLDYAVEGLLSEAGGRLRVSVRLSQLDGYARLVWSERFEAPLADPGQLERLAVPRIVARLEPAVRFTEGRAPRRERPNATTLALWAMPMLYAMERAPFEEAGRLLDEAVRREPENALAVAWAAYWELYHIGQGWAQDLAGARQRVQDLGLRAIRLGPDDAEAVAIYGHICSFLHKDFDAAVHYLDRALRLNPNLAFASALRAATCCYIGEPAAALDHLNRYKALAPVDPSFGLFESIYTSAHTFRGAYEEAVAVGRRTVRAHPGFSNGYKALIASLGHLGRIDEAKHYIDLLHQREPSFAIEPFVTSYPFRRALDRDRYAEGLRLAGVPDTRR